MSLERTTGYGEYRVHVSWTNDGRKDPWNIERAYSKVEVETTRGGFSFQSEEELQYEITRITKYGLPEGGKP